MTREEFQQKRKEIWKELKELEQEFITSNALYKVGDVIKVTFPWGDKEIVKHCVISCVKMGANVGGNILQYDPYEGKLVYAARYADFENGEWKRTHYFCPLDNLNSKPDSQTYFIVCGYQMACEDLKNISMEVVGRIEWYF